MNSFVETIVGKNISNMEPIKANQKITLGFFGEIRVIDELSAEQKATFNGRVITLIRSLVLVVDQKIVSIAMKQFCTQKLERIYDLDKFYSEARKMQTWLYQVFDAADVDTFEKDVMARRVSDINEGYTRDSNIDDLYKLGVCYEKGIGVARDLNRAIAGHFVPAANQKYAPAQNRLGQLLQSGDLQVTPIGNLAKYTSKVINLFMFDEASLQAFSFYQQAAAQNDFNALYNLGNCYENGLGTRIDLTKALECYEKAALGPYTIVNGKITYPCNHSKALYRAGYFYLVGQGCQKDLNKAYFYSKKAAEGGIDEALLNQGNALRESGVHTSRDALELYLQALDKGVKSAAYYIGLLESDPKKAFDLFKQAADAGMIEAEEKVGLCYLKGEGVDQCNYDAIMYLEKAAFHGLASANYHLALFYIDNKYYENARDHLKIAIKKGVPGAKQSLARLEEKLWQDVKGEFASVKERVKPFIDDAKVRFKPYAAYLDAAGVGLRALINSVYGLRERIAQTARD